MSSNGMRYCLFVLPLLFIISCIAGAPVNVPEDGYWENHPIEFNNSYDEVWNAALQASEEIGWNIKWADKPTGKIQFENTYVIDPLFGGPQRVYEKPSKETAEDSSVMSYLNKVSYFTKLTPQQAPPHPQFTKEKLSVDVKSMDSTRTQVKANHMIIPYFDYKIGPLGAVRSRGELEEAFYARVTQIIESDIAIPEQPPEIVEVYEISDIFFDFDKYNIRPDAVPVLEQNAQTLRENPELTVVINGYADIRGTNAYNLRLAKRRANATKNYLAKLGINPKRMIALTKGETNQFAYGTTESEYQLNRRARFLPVDPKAPVIYPPQDEY
ncbi:MAG: OmpA family protein [Thermodesulfobacteriota bacterium]